MSRHENHSVSRIIVKSLVVSEGSVENSTLQNSLSHSILKSSLKLQYVIVGCGFAIVVRAWVERAGC